jgi:hypothetical protein
MTIEIAKSVTTKEMIHWIDKEIDRVRVAGKDGEVIDLFSYACYTSHLKELQDTLNHRLEYRSSLLGGITADEMLNELQRLQARIPLNETEPAFQYHRSSLVQLETDIYNLAMTIAQSKLGEKYDT